METAKLVIYVESVSLMDYTPVVSCSSNLIYLPLCSLEKILLIKLKIICFRFFVVFFSSSVVRCVLNDLLEFTWFNVCRICYFVLTFTSQQNGLFIWKRASLCFVLMFFTISVVFAPPMDVSLDGRLNDFVWMRTTHTVNLHVFIWNSAFNLLLVRARLTVCCNPRCVSLVKQISTILVPLIRSLRLFACLFVPTLSLT